MNVYTELLVDSIELDKSNPRIANYLDLYDEDSLTSDTMALLLGTPEEIQDPATRESIEITRKSSKKLPYPRNSGEFLIL